MTPEVARWATQLPLSGDMIKHANFVLKLKKYILKITQNNSGKQEMIRATQFSTMGGPVGDPWIRAYPQHCVGPRWVPCWPHKPCYQRTLLTLRPVDQQGTSIYWTDHNTVNTNDMNHIHFITQCVLIHLIKSLCLIPWIVYIKTF